MTPQTHQAASSWKALPNGLFSKAVSLFNWLRPRTESADYQAWRHQFLRDRLRLCLWIALACFLIIVAHSYYQLFVDSEQFNADVAKHLGGDATLANQFRYLTVIENLVIGLLLAACIISSRTRWGQRYPTGLFLSFSYSITLVPQILGTLLRLPETGGGSWLLVFLVQATLMPVHWRLHILSQLVPLGYFATVNPILGLTKIGNQSVYQSGVFVYLFCFCVICDLAVFMYERLKRSEFESQRQLRVFLHSVSHDLKTPVMGTSIVLHNLLRKPEQRISVDRSVLERLLEGSDRQLNLINSLLEAHASEVQGITLNCEPLPLSDLVEAVLSDLEPVLKQNQITLVNRVSVDLPLVNADTTQLWRVFSNLITNALKHNPHGITITLDAQVVGDRENSPIGHPRKGRWGDEGTREHGKPSQLSDRNSTTSLPRASRPAPSDQSKIQWVHCTVQDNGIGMKPEQCQRLFELYTRGSRARYMPGLGLGLYLCKQIITAHGGKIGVTSRLGEGSTFWFTLPLTK